MNEKEQIFENRVGYVMHKIDEMVAENGKVPTHQEVIDQIKTLGPKPLVGGIDTSPDLPEIVAQALWRRGGRKLRPAQ
jgi:hypothetical protein